MSAIGGVGTSTVNHLEPDAGTHAPAAPAANATAAPVALGSPLLKGDAGLSAVASGKATIDIGAKSGSVKLLQIALGQTGASLGTPDGIFGRMTQSAVAAFQKQAGLPPTGSVDQKTLAALDRKVGGGAPASTTSTPATGSTGATTGAGAVTAPTTQTSPPVTLAAKRFAADPHFAAIAAGKSTLAQGAKGPDVQKLQLSLLGLGYETNGYEGTFGPGTAAALTKFQADQGLAQTGKLDAATLGKLDSAAAKKVSELKAIEPSPEDKVSKYHVVADLKRCRIYVLENGTDKPVAQYLTSPGRKEFPTLGTSFTIQSTQVMAAWHPPASDWAKDAKVVPGGIENPMGMCKLSFGAYGEYFHGIPKSEEPELGTAASHGCCRMSGANVLDFHEKYAGAGTKVQLIRDDATSAKLAAAFDQAGVATKPITAGREYSAAYLYGEMGTNEVLQKDGKIKVGGRGG
ncbi:MAG TPA: L,D-transpeptidase family protein [Planctomycetota bacterium]|nr:L,D-transpeptidase family protein [Planctomycetota bacterium]